MAGYDPREPFPGSRDSTSWEAFVQVRTGVSQLEMTSSAPANPDLQVTGTRVGIRPNVTYLADNGSSVLDESWRVCMSVTRVVSADITSDDQTVDPSCKGILSDECIDWLKNYTEAGLPCRSGSGDDSAYDLASGPCESSFSSTAGLDDNYYWGNATELRRSGMGWAYESDPQEDTMTTIWEESVKSVYLVLAGWGSTEGEWTEKKADDDAEMNPGSMVCLRPENIAAGSKSLQDLEDEEDAASLLRVDRAGRVIAIVALGAAVLANCLL